MRPQKRFTAADLAALPDDVPSGRAVFELEGGELVARGPNTYDQSGVQARMIVALQEQGERRGHGVVLGSVGVVLGRTPDTVLVPQRSSLPAANSPLGHPLKDSWRSRRRWSSSR